EAHDRVEDDIRLRAVEERREVAADLRQRGKAFDVLRPGGGGDELELGIGADNLERLRADRTCRSEEGDALHAKSLGLPQGEDGEVGRRRGKEQRVDPVEHATVSEQETTCV